MLINGIKTVASVFWPMGSVTSKKSPNIYKSCPKIKDFDTFKKLPKNVGDLGKIIVAKGLKNPINPPIWSHW